MTKLYRSSSPPPPRPLPIIQKLIVAYKVWHKFLPYFPKTSRYTLGGKINTLFLELLELLVIASYSRSERALYVQKAIIKLDLLKFFLQLAWEIKILDDKKFISLSEKLSEVGRMLGGWNKQLIKETSPSKKPGEG